nr:uncharacterized protein LOC107443523 isoform X2 [Parasteatoda tepidariorum]
MSRLNSNFVRRIFFFRNIGNIIGTHSMLTFAKGFYTSGLTYVHPNYRGSNLAFQLIRKGMERHRHKNRGVGFTFKQWTNMTSHLIGAKTEIGFNVQEYVSTESMHTNLLSDNLPGDTTIHPLETNHLELIYDYDLQVVGCERRAFLDLSFNEPHCKTLIALKNERCVGFGSVKLTVWGAKRVGPLYADDSKIAEALLKSLLEGFPQGKGVAVVIPPANSEALKLMNKSNIPLSKDLYQVHEDGVPQSDMLKVYALFDVSGTSI